MSAADRIQRLRRLIVDDDSEQPRLEAGIRAWAGQDDEARRTLERVDAARIDYLRALWQEISDDEVQATSMAHLLYMVFIGSELVVPQLTADQVDRMYEVVLGPTLKDWA